MLEEDTKHCTILILSALEFIVIPENTVHLRRNAGRRLNEIPLDLFTSSKGKAMYRRRWSEEK